MWTKPYLEINFKYGNIKDKLDFNLNAKSIFGNLGFKTTINY